MLMHDHACNIVLETDRALLIVCNACFCWFEQLSTHALFQVQFATIKEIQDKLLLTHERTKTITRSADMMEIRGTMQVYQDFAL